MSNTTFINYQLCLVLVSDGLGLLGLLLTRHPIDWLKHLDKNIKMSSNCELLINYVKNEPSIILSHGCTFSPTWSFLFFFSNKLTAPKLHASAIKEPTTFLCRLPSLKRSGFRRVFLGKSTTKSGRARVVEFSQNQTCRRPGRRPETRTLVWSGLVRSVSV